MFFCPQIQAADQGISWSDYASAVIWIKVAPEFPFQMISESKDSASFRVFEEEYRLKRTQRGLRLEVGSEATTLQWSTFEKIFRFLKAKKRSDAFLNESVLRQSLESRKPDPGYQESRAIYQCKSDLPVKFEKVSPWMRQFLSHTWLQFGANESFGMPFTDEGGYFGGLAHVRSPDSFLVRKPKNLSCSPVWIPQAQFRSEQEFTKRAECIAQKLSLPQDPVFEGNPREIDWVAHFDYHVLSQNCLKAVRLVLACAGIKAPISVNWGIGGSFDWDEKFSITRVDSSQRNQILDLRQELEHLRHFPSIENLDVRANWTLDHAIRLDSAMRGENGGNSSPKTLREICRLAKESC